MQNNIANVAEIQTGNDYSLYSESNWIVQVVNTQ